MDKGYRKIKCYQHLHGPGTSLNFLYEIKFTSRFAKIQLQIYRK